MMEVQVLLHKVVFTMQVLPWELGLAQAHQNLVENGLRSRVLIEIRRKINDRKRCSHCLLIRR